MADDFIPDDDFVPDNEPENLLQKAIKANRTSSGNPIGIAGILPTNMAETRDIGRAGFQALGAPSGWMGPMASASGHGSIKTPESLTKPETEFGKNINMQAAIAPWASLGLEGATAGAKGIHNFFSTGDLPQQIENTKGKIKDIVKLGPEKAKKAVSDIFYNFQEEFGRRLNDLQGFLHNGHYADALSRTAEELGATDVVGSPGHRASQMAEAFRGMNEGNGRLFTPEEIQAQTKQVLNSLDPLSKAKFYDHFTTILADEFPEMASLKSEYAPVYDIAKQSKRINSGTLNQVATGNIGPEQLSHMTQAQQMMGDQPNIVEQADSAGRKLNQQENELDKIIGRQKTLKGIAKTVGKGALLGAGGGGIYELIHHLFKE